MTAGRFFDRRGAAFASRATPTGFAVRPSRRAHRALNFNPDGRSEIGQSYDREPISYFGLWGSSPFSACR
jgi:hypothetical protein